MKLHTPSPALNDELKLEAQACTHVARSYQLGSYQVVHLALATVCTADTHGRQLYFLMTLMSGRCASEA